MSDLREPHFGQSPLLIFAVAISAGILLSRQLTFPPRSILIFVASVVIAPALLGIWLIRKRRLKAACVFVFTAFIFTGFGLELIEARYVVPDCISRMYEERVIASGDPVELTGTITGEPEPAPDSFYLTVSVETMRIRRLDRTASGTVLLLAHVGEQQVAQEYDALELRHGARVRVMTSLDREENFRNT